MHCQVVQLCLAYQHAATSDIQADEAIGWQQFLSVPRTAMTGMIHGKLLITAGTSDVYADKPTGCQQAYLCVADSYDWHHAPAAAASASAPASHGRLH